MKPVTFVPAKWQCASSHHDLWHPRFRPSILDLFWPLQQVLEKLPAELKAQQRNHADVAARLKRQSAHWLRGLPTTRHISDAFVLHWCVITLCAQFISASFPSVSRMMVMQALQRSQNRGPHWGLACCSPVSAAALTVVEL